MSVTFSHGFLACGATAGLKPSGKPDVALIVRAGEPPGEKDGERDGEHEADLVPLKGKHAPVGGSAMVFTTNVIVGAPVIIGRGLRAAVLAGTQSEVRAILINAGNSNAATGQEGVQRAQACCAAVAAALGLATHEVAPSSTGIIGRPLPSDKIIDKIPDLVAGLASGHGADLAAADAILTTDTVRKMARAEVIIGGMKVRIGAIAKGSGMISPRLDSAARPTAPAGTMLAFITTDAPIGSAALQHALELACLCSFDRINVDDHPSCSDTVMILSSGWAGGAIGDNSASRFQTKNGLQVGTPEFAMFSRALEGVCQDVARQVIADGEGARRIFRIEVRGAADDGSARRMCERVVSSPLVKCAIHGKDPNWGRIVTAAGNAGVYFAAEETSLTIGVESVDAVEVYRRGMPVTNVLSDAKLLSRLRAAMASSEVRLTLTVGAGRGVWWMLGCDLSKEYVAINAEYTT